MDLPQTQLPPNQEQTPTPSKIYLIILTAVIVIIAFGIYLYSQKIPKNLFTKPVPQPNQATQSAIPTVSGPKGGAPGEPPTPPTKQPKSFVTPIPLINQKK